MQHELCVEFPPKHKLKANGSLIQIREGSLSRGLQELYGGNASSERGNSAWTLRFGA